MYLSGEPHILVCQNSSLRAWLMEWYLQFQVIINIAKFPSRNQYPILLVLVLGKEILSEPGRKVSHPGCSAQSTG